MIKENLAFVKDQLAYHQRMAAKYLGRDGFRSDKHNKTAQQFLELEQFLETLPSNINTTNKPCENYIDTILPSDLKDLPDELIDELSVTDGDKEAFEIIDVIDEAGGTLSLDHLLIALYRKTGVIHKRVKLNIKINRMMRKNLIWGVPHKKGVYCTLDPSSINKDEETEEESLI